jgi:hypothetical protein
MKVELRVHENYTKDDILIPTKEEIKGDITELI